MPNNANDSGFCSFCGEKKANVKALIKGPSGALICDNCIRICHRMVSEGKTSTSFVDTKNIDYITRDNGGMTVDDTVKNYLEKLNTLPILSPDEEYTLARRVSEGDKDARIRLLESNLKLAVSIAKEYEGGNSNLVDLIQKGNIGLAKAIEHFDYKKDCNFSQYAIQFIRKEIIDSTAD